MSFGIKKTFCNFASLTNKLFKTKKKMKKYETYYECDGDGTKNRIGRGVYDSKEEAISECIKKVIDFGHNKEIEMARKALETRGYYCCGYSSYQIVMDEIEV